VLSHASCIGRGQVDTRPGARRLSSAYLYQLLLASLFSSRLICTIRMTGGNLLGSHWTSIKAGYDGPCTVLYVICTAMPALIKVDTQAESCLGLVICSACWYDCYLVALHPRTPSTSLVTVLMAIGQVIGISFLTSDVQDWRLSWFFLKTCTCLGLTTQGIAKSKISSTLSRLCASPSHISDAEGHSETGA